MIIDLNDLEYLEKATKAINTVGQGRDWHLRVELREDNTDEVLAVLDQSHEDFGWSIQ